MTTFGPIREQLRARLTFTPESQLLGATWQHAAVALILRSNAGAAELLMIKRAIRESDHWSGHLALPGGRWQSNDSDLLATAIRETGEEIGMDLSDGGEVLGELDTLRPRNPLIPRVDVTT